MHMTRLDGINDVVLDCTMTVNTICHNHDDVDDIDEAKKKICVFYRPPTVPNFWPRTLNFFIALSVENYLNTQCLPSNVVFHV